MEDSTLHSSGEIYPPASISGDLKLNTENKRQLVFGPPENYDGPRPPISCELFITNLPAKLDVPAFQKWLNRLGAVYEMRILMNSRTETRGYCFVRFFEQRSTIACLELLKFLFLGSRRPNAQISQCKREIFVTNLPKVLSANDLRQTFKDLFETTTKCVVFPQRENIHGHKNRGYAFLEFKEHDLALEAKKFLKHHRLWAQKLRVDWAKQQEANDVAKTNEATACFRKNDYSAKLRLYALANNWSIPIVVYGSNFRKLNVQYGGILLKDDNTGSYSCIIAEVVGAVFNIHVLLCEAAVHLIEVLCGFPLKHFILRIRNGSIAKILLSFTEMSTLTKSKGVLESLISSTSVINLAFSLDILGQFQSKDILSEYKLSFLSESAVTERLAKFFLIKGYEYSYFYSIYPKYRNNCALNNNFNDTEIVLLQAAATSNDNACMPHEVLNNLLTAKNPDEGAFMLKSQRFNRSPHYVLKYVDVEMLRKCKFYNRNQQLNTPPLWVGGETYQSSIFETP